MQHASAGFRAHILEVQARGIEYHVTLDRAETCGKIRSAGRGVLDVHAPGDARSVQRPFKGSVDLDRKSTRLNSSHSQISYAVFCLKKKTRGTPATRWPTTS